jgi:hypothetical protein
MNYFWMDESLMAGLALGRDERLAHSTQSLRGSEHEKKAMPAKTLAGIACSNRLLGKTSAASGNGFSAFLAR